MEMCYDGALVMPNNYTVVDEEEMTYVDGGAQVYLNRSCLNKAVCLGIGAGLSSSTGLNFIRIGMEIFAHAVLYLVGITGTVASVIYDNHIGDDVINYIVSHSNPVDIGGDSVARLAAYTAIWTYVPSM